MQTKVVYVKSDGLIIQEGYCTEGDDLRGRRLFETVDNQITNDGVYHSKQIPLNWVVSQQSMLGEVLYAVVSESPITDEEYDSLVTSNSGIISPDSFDGNIQEFREFMKKHGVPSESINSLVEGWLSFQVDAA
ncbi:MAG: hypothetical protein ACFKPT_11280 [Gloeotrichia echinulata GP01]